MVRSRGSWVEVFRLDCDMEERSNRFACKDEAMCWNVLRIYCIKQSPMKVDMGIIDCITTFSHRGIANLFHFLCPGPVHVLSG